MPQGGRSRSATAGIAALAIALAALLGNAAGVAAGGTVTNCANDTQFNSKLAGGGIVTFACGTKTIPLSSQKYIEVDTTIDGGNRITLTGGNARQHFIIFPGVRLTLKRIVLTRGYSGGDGGAIYNERGRLFLENVTISYSEAQTGSGGAIFSNEGPVSIKGSRIHHNRGANAGAIMIFHPGANLTMDRSRIYANQATTPSEGWGGAILPWDGARVTITNSDLYDNRAHMGGAINVRHVGSSVVIRDSKLHGNRATPGTTNGFESGGYGGAISIGAGSATLTRVALYGNRNTGPGFGGAIDGSGQDSVLTLTNVTISGNTSRGSGGGIYIYQHATLTNVTIVGNTSTLGSGGGYYVLDTYDNQVWNVVLAGNRQGTGASAVDQNCYWKYGPVTNLSRDLSDDNTCGFGGGRDNVATKLGPLDTNGGSTPTHRLLPGSPAIDDGAFCPSTDQRKVHRPQGPACDIGAFELVRCPGGTPAASLVAPAAGATVGSAAVTLDWARPDCAKTFNVVVRRGSSGGSVVFSRTGLAGSSVKTPAPAGNQAYVWRVTACAASCTNGPWWSFRVN